MKTHGISVYPEVCKKADWVKVLLDVIVKEFKSSTNIDFEKDSYSEVRDVDVDTHIMSIETEKAYGESEEYDDKPVEDHDSEQYGYQDEEGGPCATWGKSSERGCQTRGKSKEKGKFHGACYKYGKMGHRSRDCWSERSKGKRGQKGNAGYTKSEHGCKGGYNYNNSSYNHYKDSYKEGCKYVNVSQSFAPQPQPLYQKPGEGH